MTEVRTFSPWCQMCLDGEDGGRIDAHELHVLRLKRQRAKRPSKLQWRLAKNVPPAPGKAVQGERLAPDSHQCHDDCGDGDDH